MNFLKFFKCPNCGWDIWEEFEDDGRSHMFHCPHCESTLEITEFSFDVSIEKIEISEKKDAHL